MALLDNLKFLNRIHEDSIVYRLSNESFSFKVSFSARKLLALHDLHQSLCFENVFFFDFWELLG